MHVKEVLFDFWKTKRKLLINFDGVWTHARNFASRLCPIIALLFFEKPRSPLRLGRTISRAFFVCGAKSPLTTTTVLRNEQQCVWFVFYHSFCTPRWDSTQGAKPRRWLPLGACDPWAICQHLGIYLRQDKGPELFWSFGSLRNCSARSMVAVSVAVFR